MKTIKLLKDQIVYLGTAMPIRCCVKKGTPLIEATNLPAGSDIGFWVADDGVLNDLVQREDGGCFQGYDWERVKSYHRNYGIPIYKPAWVIEHYKGNDFIDCTND